MDEFHGGAGQKRRRSLRGLAGIALTALWLIMTLAGGASARVTSARVATQPIPTVTPLQIADAAVTLLKKATRKVASHQAPRLTTIAQIVGQGSVDDSQPRLGAHDVLQPNLETRVSNTVARTLVLCAQPKERI